MHLPFGEPTKQNFVEPLKVSGMDGLLQIQSCGCNQGSKKHDTSPLIWTGCGSTPEPCRTTTGIPCLSSTRTSSHVTKGYPMGHMTSFATLLTFWRSAMDVGWDTNSNSCLKWTSIISSIYNVLLFHNYNLNVLLPCFKKWQFNIQMFFFS